MRLFIDTDVLVDMAIDRQPFADASARLLDRLEAAHQSHLVGFLSWNSFLEFSQEVTPIVGHTKTAEFCSELCAILKIANVKGTHLSAAFAFNLPEFRATLQAAAAIACKADLIVTSNHQQFSGLRIPVKAPTVLMDDVVGA